jgi:hypothetical protein
MISKTFENAASGRSLAVPNTGGLDGGVTSKSSREHVEYSEDIEEIELTEEEREQVDKRRDREVCGDEFSRPRYDVTDWC